VKCGPPREAAGAIHGLPVEHSAHISSLENYMRAMASGDQRYHQRHIVPDRGRSWLSVLLERIRFIQQEDHAVVNRMKWRNSGSSCVRSIW